MIQQRVERREWIIVRQDADPDARGHRTQRAVWFRCPFCEALVKGFVWSLHGRGKRCACGALHTWKHSERIPDLGKECNAGVAFRLEETPGSWPGRIEVEVFAPDGLSFEGDRHSLIARGATLADARLAALSDARSTRLVSCAPDCDCQEEEKGRA